MSKRLPTRLPVSPYVLGLALAANLSTNIGLSFASSSAAANISPASIASVEASASPRLKPPPPEPEFISRGDLTVIKSVKSALDAKQFSTARRAIDTLQDDTAKSLGLWYYFRAEDPLVSYGDVVAFLDDHPNWPSLTRIQRHAEEELIASLPGTDVVEFYANRSPATIDGAIALAKALRANGETDKAGDLIREFWRTKNIKASDEEPVLAEFSSALGTEDHAARVDRLLSKRQVTNARRTFGYLDSQDKKLAKVRAELLMQGADAGAKYDALSDQERLNRGVFHAALRYFRRSGNEVRAIQIARARDSILASSTSKDVGDDAGAFAVWYERQLLMRHAIKEGLYADAYVMAAGHGLAPGSTSFSEAQFNAGWLALRFLDEPVRARDHFAALTASVGAPISLARGYYWLGRADQAASASDSAQQWYQKAAGYPYTYYGQLAAEELGEPLALQTRYKKIEANTSYASAAFSQSSVARAAQILTDIGDERSFLIFSYHLDDQLDGEASYILLADTASRLQAPHISVRAGKAAVRRGYFAPQVSYPEISVPDTATSYAPREVILGLSRQESEFNASAYSRAGARGIMQLMPATAKITANKEGLPYKRSALLSDPHYNMVIGSAHLSHLLERFDGSWPMVFAAYNAGARRVDEWVERYGDPRSSAVDPVDWIEQIPFSETRNYVQRVLENTQIYRSALGGSAIAGRLSADIESGGPLGRAGKKPALASRGFVPEAPTGTKDIAKLFLAEVRLAAADFEGPASTPQSQTSASSSPRSTRTEISAQTSSTNEAPDQVAKNVGEETKREDPAKVNERLGSEITETAISSAPTLPTTGPRLSDQTTTKSDPTGNSSETVTDAIDQPPSVTVAVDQADRSTAISTEGTGGQEQALPSLAPFQLPQTAEVLPEKECEGYAEFIASLDPENASAQDLNAGVLASLTSGTESCG